MLTNSAVSAELGGLAARAVLAETGQVHAGKRHGRAADQSFLGIGIPSMFGSLSHQPLTKEKMRNALGWWWHTRHDLADKIDQQNLIRDTRIVTRVLRELLTDLILPIDHAAQMSTLLAELSPLEAPLQDIMTLGKLRQTIIGVIEASRHLRTFLDTTITAEPAWHHAVARPINDALVRASRALVPLDYTTGDRFTHDPALALPAWPCLEPLRILAAALKNGTDRDQIQLLATGAIRARNRLLHGLDQAADLLEQACPR